MELRSNQHSVFRLNYHLIMCIKYRKQVLDDIISYRLRAIFEKICADYKITLVEWEHDKDHVHCLLFCLISVGGAPLEVLKHYIQSQGM